MSLCKIVSRNLEWDRMLMDKSFSYHHSGCMLIIYMWENVALSSFLHLLELSQINNAKAYRKYCSVNNS